MTLTRRRTVLITAAALAVIIVAATFWQRANPFRIETSIELDAPPSAVWQQLTDFAAYPEWNPSLVDMKGTLAVGETLFFRADATPGALTFEPEVLEVVPEKTLRWEGHLLITGLFDGEHQFSLEPLEGGGTRLVHAEDFRGILVPFLTGWLNDNTRAQFVAMNEALRNRVSTP